MTKFNKVITESNERLSGLKTSVLMLVVEGATKRTDIPAEVIEHGFNELRSRLETRKFTSFVESL